MRTVTAGWFEIPVINMDRAIKFYNKVFEITISKQNFGGIEMGWFPYSSDAYGAPGSLIQSAKDYKPSTNGTLVYLNCDDLANELNRIEKAGGTILQKKTQISEEHGYMGLFVDTEGNRVALHSNK